MQWVEVLFKNTNLFNPSNPCKSSLEAALGVNSIAQTGHHQPAIQWEMNGSGFKTSWCSMRTILHWDAVYIVLFSCKAAYCLHSSYFLQELYHSYFRNCSTCSSWGRASFSMISVGQHFTCITSLQDTQTMSLRDMYYVFERPSESLWDSQSSRITLLVAMEKNK